MKIEPNYKLAERSAQSLLIQFNVNSLPTQLEAIYKSFSNLRVKNYSWYAKFYQLSIEEVIEYTGSQSGFCYRDPDKKGYMIVYNDLIETEGHKRWTIAHELGHFILDHHSKCNKEIVTRKFVRNSEYDVYEKEANCFARELLAPPSVLHALKKFNSSDLVEWCNISMMAAINTYKFFNTGISNGRRFNPSDKLVKLFSEYIHQNVHERKCNRCKHYFVIPEAIYCPSCGGKRLSKRKGTEIMSYSGYELNEHGRPYFCPRCSNDEIGSEDEFCKICGLQIVNRCTGVVGTTGSGYNEEPIYCDVPQSGNARFCVKCGGETTYYKNGILLSWLEDLGGNKEVAVAKQSDDPFANVPAVNDDDLPF